MLNLGRNDRWVDVKDANKPAKPATTAGTPQSNVANPAPRPSGTPTAPVREASEQPAQLPPSMSVSPSPEEKAGSKLFVGANIKLKGVEISNCDVLVIEGQVDATVNSKVMEISKPGTLTGTAMIDVAEIHGEFSGELTARVKLVVHGTGRVTGTVRYGKLVVAEGGTLTGELKQIDAATQDARPSTTSTITSSEPRPQQPQPAH